jgi:hypothetical protein
MSFEFTQILHDAAGFSVSMLKITSLNLFSVQKTVVFDPSVNPPTDQATFWSKEAKRPLNRLQYSICWGIWSPITQRGQILWLSRPLLRLMYGEYWFCLSRLSMMVTGSFAFYTKTKSVESAVWCLLTLDDGGEQVTGTCWIAGTSSVNGIEIPEQSSGSELFFFFWTTIKTKLKWRWNKIIKQRIKQLYE